MENSRFMKIVIVTLLLINFGTLAFMWSTRESKHGFPPPPPPPSMQQPGGPFMFLVHELQLSDKQTQQYEQLRDAHHKAMDSLEEKNKSLRDRLFKLLPETDAGSKAKPLSDSIAANQKEIELVTFEHFQNVRAICTPEQQKKFDSVIGDALRMMAPPPPQPGPGGPPPPPDR